MTNTKMSGEVSKDEKERQLDAKIAAIRAKNEEKLQRQREVEKDRKLAEKQNQSITTAPRVKKEEDYEHTFVGPDRNDKVNSSKSGKTETRRDESFGSGEKMETKQRIVADISSLPGSLSLMLKSLKQIW